MARGDLLGPSEALSDGKSLCDAPALSAESTSAGALLVHIGTKVNRQGFVVKVFPSCREGSVSLVQGSSGYVDWVAPFERQVSRGRGSSRVVEVVGEDDSRGRQAKTAVRRMCRHNGLAQLVTFTFAEVPPLDSVGVLFMHFWRRWMRATGRPIPPYVLVPEWGKETHRLHVHVGVSWWDELSAVEVCDLCARDGLREKRFAEGLSVPPAGSFCVGCLWGHGFVGRPESNAVGNGLSGYLGKYLAKDMVGQFDAHTGAKIEGVPFGGHRYRASIGALPSPLRVWVPTMEVGRRVLSEIAGDGSEPDYCWLPSEGDPLCGRVEWHDFWKGAA